MKLSHFACTAVILLGIAQTAAAQAVEPTGTGGNTASTPGVVATIDVSRLPVNVSRIGKQLQQKATTTDNSQGLRLRYSVDVYGQLPGIVVVTAGGGGGDGICR